MVFLGSQKLKGVRIFSRLAFLSFANNFHSKGAVVLQSRYIHKAYCFYENILLHNSFFFISFTYNNKMISVFITVDQGELISAGNAPLVDMIGNNATSAWPGLTYVANDTAERVSNDTASMLLPTTISESSSSSSASSSSSGSASSSSGRWTDFYPR